MPPLNHRLEDHRFITGAGRYVSDLVEPDDLHAHFHRSVVAHGDLAGIDIATASDEPGVAVVLTHAALGLPAIAAGDHAEGRFERPLLASGKVRYVGEPIAAVVAETKQAAVDAASLIWADIDPLEAVTDPETSAASSIDLFEGGNVVASWISGSDLSQAEFDSSVTVTLNNQRLAPAPIEGLAIRAVPTDQGGLVVYCGHQAPHRFRDQLATQLSVAPELLRVVVPDVGGAFGLKGMAFPEYLVVAAAALRIGRPVVWVEERREHFVSGTHGRGQRHRVTVEGEMNGRIRRIRIDILADVGAYPHNGALIPHLSTFVAQGLYDVDEFSVSSTVVVTNRAPTGSYRGAGRPEAAFAIERAVDEFAMTLDLDPAEVRTINFVQPDRMPYVTHTGARYDSGDYERALRLALDMVDVDSVRTEQSRRRSEGEDPIGLGIATFVERAGGAIDSGEFGHVRVGEDGRIHLLTGTTSAGQGHETVWPQLVAPLFGLAPEEIVVIAGDTDRVARGVGTFASRSAQVGGSALVRSAVAVVSQVKEASAAMLEANVEDLTIEGGRVQIVGDPESSVGLAEVAMYSAQKNQTLESSEMFTPGAQAFPFGAHVVLVEVSVVTGEVRILRYVAVDDCGNVLNPMIVEGQVVGSLVQGYGQAILEGVEYGEGGDPLTTSFMDYLIPAAVDSPTFDLGRTYSPAPSNPLGVKGTGEAGCIGAPPAIVNAALDALRPHGVTDLQMPLRPHRVWAAIQAARSS